ncbi:DeoR/GlpR family DNA-binding transcription regulator [Aurantimonas sp. C2-5-R2]|uniref:DeoR/GlpR family DNA-binding transcription regulator n=1 Tax=Aurantimonas sp. C2-5-R2 TaxID=3113713 RepID=UPI002F95BF72
MKDQRTQHILDLLSVQGSVAIRDLAARLGASEMTLRRDLGELETRGLLRRVHGGAVLSGGGDPGYWLRSKQSQPEKAQIGRAAANLVASGHTVFIDAGTTTTEIARALARRAREESLNIRVVTQAINIVTELAAEPSIDLHQIGGQIDPTTLAATGITAIEQIKILSFDLLFLGFTGVDFKAGWTNSGATGVEVKRAAMHRATRAWAAVDSSKWQVTSFFRVASLEAVQGWITDPGLAEADRKQVRDAGLDLVVAET